MVDSHPKGINMGPLKSIGAILNTVTTTVQVVESVVTRTAKLIDTGFDAIELPTNNMLEDLRCDNIVDSAKRRVRIANANAEALEIEQALLPQTTKKAVAKKTVAKATTK